MRLTGKSGIVVGAGQTPGDTIGNGRAAAMLFAREGANVMLVDRDLQRAEETAALIAAAGGIARCIAGDWTRAADCRAYVEACIKAFGRNHRSGFFGALELAVNQQHLGAFAREQHSRCAPIADGVARRLARAHDNAHLVLQPHWRALIGAHPAGSRRAAHRNCSRPTKPSCTGRW